MKGLGWVITVRGKFLSDGLNVITNFRVFIDTDFVVQVSEERLAECFLLKRGDDGSGWVANFGQFDVEPLFSRAHGGKQRSGQIAALAWNL